MPSSDVVVVGAGLAGLTAGDRAGRCRCPGRRRRPRPRGNALDRGRARRRRAAEERHRRRRPGAASRRGGAIPYAFLASDARPAIEWLIGVLAEEGVAYAGDLDAPLRSVPTAIGATRRVALVPDAQAAALAPWAPEERLVICGPAGFKDFWPAAIAASLERPRVWGGGGDMAVSRPARIEAVSVELPGLGGRRNLNALHLARLFDDPAWRETALDHDRRRR